MEIAIDTSTGIASLAITREGEILAELTWRCGQNHTVELLPWLAQLLARANLDIGSARGVIVARGPGSFNGLRVGVSTAKALAFTLGIPLAGIGTLEVAAYAHAALGLPVCPVFGAGREEIAVALYRMVGDEWRQVETEHLTTVEALCHQTSDETVFCGEIPPPVAEEIKIRLQDRAVIPSPAARLRRAVFLAELGRKRLAAGDLDNPATLQPIYLRRPPITERKR